MRKTFLGYFLFFSLFLCCFYACVQDENSGSSKIDRFFNTSDADKYLQGVVSSLKQKNDSSDFATEFIKTYGYPLWSNAVAFLEGKCYTYAVPVKSLLPNSEINAIWFFVMNDSCTNYHVYSRKMADAITRQVGDERQQTWMFDYFTYYALHKKPASGLKFEEMPVTRTKSTVEEKTCVGFAYSDGTTFEFGIYCWDSGNGSGSGSDDGSSGDTYSEPDYPDPGSGSVDDTRPPVDPSNGGSGGGNDNTTPTNSKDSTALKIATEKKINEKLKKNCGFSEALDEIGGLDKLTGGIIIDDDFTGGYDPSKKQIRMHSSWDGDVTSFRFMEELIHFMQDQIYDGGIQSKATTNIEFEAKVIQDLYSLGRNEGKLYLGESKVLQRIDDKIMPIAEYKKFLKSIGKGKMSDDDYLKNLKLFNQYTPYSTYKNKMDEKLKPQLLNSYGKKFYSNKCK